MRPASSDPFPRPLPRSKFDATDRQERRLSHASEPESPAYRLHPPSVNGGGRSPRHSTGAASADPPTATKPPRRPPRAAGARRWRTRTCPRTTTWTTPRR